MKPLKPPEVLTFLRFMNRAVSTTMLDLFNGEIEDLELDFALERFIAFEGQVPHSISVTREPFWLGLDPSEHSEPPAYKYSYCAYFEKRLFL